MPLLDIAPPGTDIWVPGLLIAVGIVGIVVPVVPGLVVALLGVLLWSFQTGTTLSWVVFAACAVLYAAGLTLQVLLPGRRLRTQGVGTRTLLLAALLGVVGFFALPVVGGPLGFVLGIYLVEAGRSRDRSTAWARTRHALTAVVLSMGIELAAGLLIATTWVVGVLLA